MTKSDRGFRVERDALGEVQVPFSARYGPQTQRAVENFPVSGRRLDRRLIRALALVKGEAALVNAALDEVPGVDDAMGGAIAAAAEEVAAGDWDDEFPVDVFQTGSGTSSNMNMNEVLASLAGERLGAPVHPNDHVNASQSSNDVFPTAVHLAVAEAVRDDLLPALDHLGAALARQAERLAPVVKAGRTHLMDATPVTLGQEFGGYTAQVGQAAERLADALPRVGEVPLGGTAVGTGINAPADFGPLVVAALARRTGLPLSVARDRFAAQSARDGLVDVSGLLRVVAVVLVKVANDVRWMASGPRAGLAELHLPDLQPGSSIMPGKVNPVIPEAVTQVAAHVIGNDAAVAFAGSQGAFELNVFQPMMAHEVLESVRLLTAVARLFADRCIDGIEADADRCRAHAESSPAIATALNPYLGYATVARVVQRSVAERRTIREIVLDEGLLAEDRLDAVLDVEAMTRGGLPPPPSS